MRRRDPCRLKRIVMTLAGTADQRRPAGRSGLRSESSTPTPWNVPVGEAGELWFRTPQLMEGYQAKPEATAEAITRTVVPAPATSAAWTMAASVFVEDRLRT